jgi:hypothetical protein
MMGHGKDDNSGVIRPVDNRERKPINHDVPGIAAEENPAWGNVSARAVASLIALVKCFRKPGSTSL